MGHLEAAAAAAGLASLSAVALMCKHVGPNAQLRTLNAHVHSLLTSRSVSQSTSRFHLPVEVVT